MLDHNDIEILKNMMQGVVKETEQNILNKVDIRLTETEQNILEKVDVRIAETEQNILEKVDVRIAEIEQKMDEKITHSENLILSELDRVQTHLEKDIEKTQENLDELKQFYRIDRLETDNTSLLLKMYNDMQKEIAEIKAKIA